MTVSARFLILLPLGVLLAACAHRESPPANDRIPFDQRLSHFQSLHNGTKFEELRAYFTKDATIQSPLTPRPVGVEKYLTALKAEPYQLSFSRTEVVYSLPTRAATRSDAVASAPGRFDLKERVTVDWRVENGYWRISRILFPNWSPIVGTWRRGGLRGEGSIELRILPDGKYLVVLAADASTPEFRGHLSRRELTGSSLRIRRQMTRTICKPEREPMSSCARQRASTCARFRTRTPGGRNDSKALGWRLADSPRKAIGNPGGFA